MVNLGKIWTKYPAKTTESATYTQYSNCLYNFETIDITKKVIQSRSHYNIGSILQPSHKILSQYWRIIDLSSFCYWWDQYGFATSSRLANFKWKPTQQIHISETFCKYHKRDLSTRCVRKVAISAFYQRHPFLFLAISKAEKTFFCLTPNQLGTISWLSHRLQSFIDKKPRRQAWSNFKVKVRVSFNSGPISAWDVSEIYLPE